MRIIILSLLTSLVLLVGCNSDEVESQQAAATPAAPATIEWKMVTTWPKNFPGLGTSAQHLADTITAMSGGRLNIKLFAAGELVGAFEVFDAVSQGTAQMGHGAAYYWKNKAPAAQFFTAVPFGMNAQEMNAWLYHGGGLELWEKVYDRFNLISFPTGNTGVQMGGWFKKEINSVADLKVLKMRTPGMGGEILKRLGGTPVSLPGGEIFTSLQTGTIDASEWVGPFNDFAMGFYKVAQYYYYPGWQEPNAAMEAMINKDAFNALPADLQAILKGAIQAENMDMLSEFTAKNNIFLEKLINEHKVELREFPADMMQALYQETQLYLDEQAASDPEFKEVLTAYRKFHARVRKWHNISESAYDKTLTAVQNK